MIRDKGRFELLEKLGKILIKTGALQFGTFKLSSGKISSYYIDLRIVPSFPEIFSNIIDFFVEIIEEIIGMDNIDAIGGIPTAGLTYATAVAYKLKKPLVYVRKDIKKHGFQKKIEGLIKPGWKLVILDDLITTGNSIINTTRAIREEGGLIQYAVVLIDRMEGGENNLITNNIELKSLTKITEIADFLYRVDIINQDQKESIYEMIKKKNV